MAASTNDKVTQASGTSRPTPTTLSAQKAIAAASISCGALTGWPTATKVHFMIYNIDTSGAKVAGSQTDWSGIVSGTSITTLVLKAGTDAVYGIGAVVEAGPTAAWADDLYTGFTKDHDSQGRHAQLTDTNGVKILGLTPVASAVNDLIASNSATLTDLDLAAEGTDTNISASFTPKGTGQFYFKKRHDGWVTGLPTPNTVTYNGHRNYSLVFNAVDLTSYIFNGQRFKLTRTVTAPTQCTSLASASSQFYSKASPSGCTFTDNFTTMAWVKMATYTGANAGIIGRFSTSGFFMRVTATGQVEIYADNGATSRAFTSSQSLPLNKWVHVAATLNMAGAVGHVYLDGDDVTVTSTGAAGTVLIQAGNINVGAYNGANFFNGKIAQAAIFSSVLAQATIQSYASQTLSGAESTAVAVYSLNNTINDLTANANNLTASGGAVATNADSPFAGGGNAATAYTAGTTEFGEVFNIVFSTNTTVTVQVPPGHAIPTSGGVSALAYSAAARPLGWPMNNNVIGYAQLTSNATSTNTASPYTAVNGLSVTIYVPAGRGVELTLVADHASPPASANAMTYIAESTTLLMGTQSSTSVLTPINLSYVVYPTAGSHTYIARLGEVNAAGTTTLFASITEPCYLMAKLLD